MAVIEIKTLCLIRVPPGDRWREPEGTEIFPTLTSALERIYSQTGCKEYRFSADEGKVYIVSVEEEKPITPRKYSIYGDES